MKVKSVAIRGFFLRLMVALTQFMNLEPAEGVADEEEVGLKAGEDVVEPAAKAGRCPEIL